MQRTLLPLQGVTTHRVKTQGVALGYMLLPLQGALAKVEYIYLLVSGKMYFYVQHFEHPVSVARPET